MCKRECVDRLVDLACPGTFGDPVLEELGDRRHLQGRYSVGGLWWQGDVVEASDSTNNWWRQSSDGSIEECATGRRSIGGKHVGILRLDAPGNRG